MSPWITWSLPSLRSGSVIRGDPRPLTYHRYQDVDPEENQTQHPWLQITEGFDEILLEFEMWDNYICLKGWGKEGRR
jgi:hypothetical protein